MSHRHHRPVCRSLLIETLETRQLLVAGIGTPEAILQNYANPEDTNYDGIVSPADALIVINQLNAKQNGSPKHYSTDIDGDGVVSPRDALLVINRLNSRSDTSSVPPQQRAIGLRKALDAGWVPPNMSLSEAHELLATLDHGGHYEAGDRYRDGKMINTNEQLVLDHPLTTTEAEENSLIPQHAESPSEASVPNAGLRQSIEEDDPFASFDMAGDPPDDSPLWTDDVPSLDAESVPGLSTQTSDQLADRLVSEDAHLRANVAASQAGDRTTQVAVEIAGPRATLGDARSQLAQLFASLDIDEIMERVGVDLGTLARAALWHDRPAASDRAAIFSGFLSRDYLRGLEILPP